jgi:hypothetical protein
MYLAPCRLHKTVLANRLRFRVRSLYRMFKKFVYSIKQKKTLFIFIYKGIGNYGESKRQYVASRVHTLLTGVY